MKSTGDCPLIFEGESDTHRQAKKTGKTSLAIVLNDLDGWPAGKKRGSQPGALIKGLRDSFFHGKDEEEGAH